MYFLVYHFYSSAKNMVFSTSPSSLAPSLRLRLISLAYCRRAIELFPHGTMPSTQLDDGASEDAAGLTHVQDDPPA